jgi:SAM-dependent methyltransferase
VARVTVLERLLEQPWVYGAWQAPFAARKFRPVERELARLPVRRVLDVGCGPGTNAHHFAHADYVGVDINGRYLGRARARHAGRFIQADLSTADLSSLGTFDTVLVNSFLHHLPDVMVDQLLGRVAERLNASGRIHVLELVLPQRWSLAKVMARCDRGRYARPLACWNEIFSAHFTPVIFEPYVLGPGLWSMVYFQGGRR